MRIGETGAEGLMGTPPTCACVLSMHRDPENKRSDAGCKRPDFESSSTSVQFKVVVGRAHARLNACERVLCATVVTSQLTRGHLGHSSRQICVARAQLLASVTLRRETQAVSSPPTKREQ
jgi:hypothetical protein